jgi:hypothetical protein
MIYELRIYHIHQGKMEDINKRFQNVTINLFRKHGMNIIDFWEDAEGDNKIFYLVEHKDIESRNKNFESFRNDPEWIDAKSKSELNGPIVEKIESYFMRRVPYSPANGAN